jgi:aerobic carbon-monoxide dehydrogenase medium subunit
MIRTPLRVHRPGSLDEATALLEEHRDDAAVLGGGTVLVPQLGRGERSVTALIDLGALGLDGITREADELVVGARVTYSRVAESRLCQEHAPLLAEVATRITGGVQLRNQATYGGSACYANPSSDAPAVLVALRARLVVAGTDSSRLIDARAFFTGAFATTLAPGELVTHIRVPNAAAPYAYEKVKHCEGSWPIVSCAATTTADGRRAVTLGGVCTTPVEVVDADGGDLTERIAAALREPWSDALADGTYRTAVAPALARRVLDRLDPGATR